MGAHLPMAGSNHFALGLHLDSAGLRWCWGTIRFTCPQLTVRGSGVVPAGSGGRRPKAIAELRRLPRRTILDWEALNLDRSDVRVPSRREPNLPVVPFVPDSVL